MITGRNRIYEDPKVSTNYSILIAEDTNDRYEDIYKDDGLFYAHKDGTTSQSGYAMIVLGNNKASGTDKNKAGMLRVTDDASVYWWNIKGNPNSPLTGYRDVFLPPNSGTLATKPVILYNNAEGSTGTVTLTQTINNFHRIKIFWRWAVDANGRFEGCTEIHRIRTDSVYATFTWTNMVPSSTSATFDHYACTVVLNDTTITPAFSSSIPRSGYYRIYPTTTSATSNVLYVNGANFYITRVMGYFD